MTTILITGAGGQLGRELTNRAWPASYKVHAADSASLDITERDAVLATVKKVEPTVIINAAAYTDVDGAEDDEDRAMAVNATAVEWLADAADRVGAMLVQVSTDYVFAGRSPDGGERGWYVEDDEPVPCSAYGRTKLAGEQAAVVADKAVVVRSSGLYAAHGRNFVNTMLRLAAAGRDIGVVGDQLVCPTAAGDVAEAIVGLVAASDGGADHLPSRYYHAASPDAASWHEFALAIFDASAAGFDGRCRLLTTAEYRARAARPADSRLDSSRLAEELGIRLPSWRSSLPFVVTELEREAGAEQPVNRSADRVEVEMR